MNSSLKQSLAVMWALMRRDLLVTRQQIWQIIFDSAVWPIRNAIVFAYIMVGAGVSSYFGIFYFIGMMPSVPIFRITRGLASFLEDFERTRAIDFELMLPCRIEYVFVRHTILFALQGIGASLAVIPVGLFLLFGRLSFLQVNPLKFILIIIAYNYLIACATLWLAGWVKDLTRINSIWNRYTHTLWLFGCVMFSFKKFHAAFPFWAALDLLNPVTYIMEGTRSCTLDSSAYLNFWLCLFMICAFSAFFLWRGIVLLKKRLDAV